MRILLFFTMLQIGCNNLPITSGSSFWKTQKDNFKYSNLKLFSIDSAFLADYKSFRKIFYESQSSQFPSASVYLYSWQDRDETKSEFTLIKDEGENGINIYYLILDKTDNIISATKVAGKGSEGYYTFESKSKFISKDTLQHTAATTKWLDEATHTKIKIKGDSSFLFLCIDKNGKVNETPSPKKW